VLNLLEDSINVTVANPKWVRAVKGNKDDVKDSKWIGDLFRLGLVPGSFIPSKPVRILREYTQYLFNMVNAKSSEKNRYQNVFTVCNVALDAVVSDMFGVSASNITNYLTHSDTFDPDYCVTLLRGTLKGKAEYERIMRRRGKKRAIIAIARMILTAIYHMLSTGEVWSPCDLPRIDMPPETRERELKKDIRRAAKLLVANGIINLSDYNLPNSA
jgi:hypothetical protein